jgi:uncharacterized repeat protein (TIGR01451 family)
VPKPGADPNAGFSLGDLPGGETVRVRFAAEVRELPDPNPLQNTADLRYRYTPVEGGVANVYETQSNAVPLQVTSANLVVRKTASQEMVLPGTVLTYVINASNSGPSQAENVEILDIPPAALENPEYSLDDGLTWQPWTGRYQKALLPAGEGLEILVRGTVAYDARGTLSNRVEVSTTTPTPDPRHPSATATTAIAGGTADLSLTKTVRPNPVSQGEYVTFFLTVYNAGPDAAFQTVLTDDLPRCLIDRSYSIDGGISWQPWTGSVNLGNLEAGETVQVRIAGFVCPGSGKFLRNTATVASHCDDPDPSNNTASITANILRPSPWRWDGSC